MNAKQEAPLSVYLVVGEESGDQLGAGLIEALRAQSPCDIRFHGVGGERMAAQGVVSLFPIEDIAVMGLSAVLPRLPLIVKRVYQTVDDIVKRNPDVVVIIDSPDFTHNVAKRVRKRAPHIPVVDYVSPSVWAWRPGRARRMAAYVDHLLAILPFEPQVHKRLGGPPTTYVGHPLIERADRLRPAPGERSDLESDGAPVLLVLPGSRRSEISRLLADFGAAVAILKETFADLEVILPAVPHLRERIAEETAGWAVKPQVVSGEAEKLAAFRRGHAALAASGTVTLELAIAGVPMAVAYRLDWFYRRIKDLNRFLPIATVTSMVLPNIILGENVVPEFLDDGASPEALAATVAPLLQASPQRDAQVAAFRRLDDEMQLGEGRSQAGEAARIVLDVAAGR
ncbi:lipid-A-disaccharide synthase [Stappia sp. ES.058]|uniref:lipid-A-disaccharide synthase n=1 Tax=Stappia sp. ES.058 TaxID=1881061 RepID=UPI000879B1DD|nr:lipid-A-disaccharide synthase [Stappia sp. ES.058]SDU11471.1 lipid-A-disaccharide synthase [Stappia sp. ES.058]